MHIATPFDPIEVGETDNFAFDFTADVGAAKIESTQWMCALAPYQMANDPAPQSRIISVSAQSAIHVRSPVNGSLLTRDGSFSVALIGGMPPSAAGAIYILAATVQGTITGVSGANAGSSRTVANIDQGVVYVKPGYLSPVSVGDEFQLLPGCDRTLTTCTNVFNNAIHFGGFPYIPTPETAV